MTSIRIHAGLLADTADCVRDSKPRITATPTGQCTYDGRPAHEIRTGDLGNRYGLCFDCAQDWQAVKVRREDVPQVAALARSLYLAAAERAGYTATRQPEPAPVEDALDLNKVVAALPEVVDHAMQTAIPHRYTPELAEAIAADIRARLTGDTTTPCPVFRDCADTTPGHDDHHSHDIKVVDDADGSTILDAGMVANSGSDRHAIVYLRNAEFTDPASVREKTAEVRAFLDRVDALADRVFADAQVRTEQAGGDDQ